MSVNLNRLLDDPIPLSPDKILHYYEKHNFSRPGILMQYRNPIPLNGFFNLFQDQSIVVFCEDVQKETRLYRLSLF